MNFPPSESSVRSPSRPSEEEIASSLRLLRKIFPEQHTGLDPEEREADQIVYSHAITLWMFILQRIGGGKSLSEVVAHVLAHDRDLLPDNKRVREQTLSDNTGAFSRARKRLPLDKIVEFSRRVCDYLGQISEPVMAGRRVFILDGTTITLPPTKALQKAYPPASNQHGPSVWPIARLMVAHELQSGCALLPQVDPIGGENKASEAVQAQRIVTQLPAHSIVLADTNFGIYSVAHHATRAGHAFLFRLTKSRHQSLRKKAELIDEGPKHKTYHLQWKPSRQDRNSTPGLAPEASLEVVIHEVELDSGVTLCLISSLEVDGPSSANLYRRRYDVEFDIRDLKITLDTENIRAKSVEMFQKELYTSVVAYNLVAQFRRQAAAMGQVPPRRLSFKGVWTTLKYRLLFQPKCSLAEWLDRYATALDRASKRKHPQRKQPRSYPRKAHRRSQKTTKFAKAQRLKKPLKNETTPPEKPK
jgi:hypothetical protein